MSGLIGSVPTGILPSPTRPVHRPEKHKWLRISGAIENHVVQSTLSILSFGQMVIYVKSRGDYLYSLFAGI
jgi:hypothetical protein